MIQSGTTIQVSTDSGHDYVDPDESMLYQLFLHLEERATGHLTLVAHPPSQEGLSPQLTLTRRAGGSYRIEERDGAGEVHEAIVRNMALAHDSACRWARTQAS